MGGNNSNANRFPLPDNWNVTEYVCMVIPVPNDPQYIAMMRGLLDTLTWSRSFRLHPTENAARQVADTWKAAFESKVFTFEGCTMPEFRIDPDTCLLEVNCSEDPNNPDWKPVFTPDYNPTEDAPPVQLYPDEPPVGETNQCLAAENVTAWMTDGMAQFTTLLGQGLGDNVVAMVVSLLYSLLSQLVSIVQANLWFTILEVDWGDFNYATIEADFDAFDWDDFKNLIVCYFDDNGSMSPAKHLEALDEMEAHGGQIWRAIRLVWSLAGSIGISQATRWAGITDGDCEPCGEWCVVFNAANGWGDFQPYMNDPIYGSLVSGEWISADNDVTALVIESPHLVENHNFTEVRFTYQVVGSVPPFGQHRINIISEAGTTTLQTIEWSAGTYTVDILQAMVGQYFYFDIEAPLGYISAKLTEVTICGEGVNPYE